MNEQKEKSWKQYLVMIVFMLIGAVYSFLMLEYIDSVSTLDSLGNLLLLYGVLTLILVGIIFLQIIIHEAGHLVFGLLTGYRFSSFRIGSFMWVKENGKLHLKRFSISGTGGQCLMIPPEMKDGKIPFVLYNLGGSLFNLISGLIFLGLFFLSRGIPYLSLILLLTAFTGFALALMNGIPIGGRMNNDGYNILSISRSKEAQRSFWKVMKINEQTAKGIRLKDMPAEWFVFPSPDEMKNGMNAVIAVLACNRLMDGHEFEKADQLMEELLQMDTAMVDVHRRMVICDQIFCELIGPNRQDRLKLLFDNGQKKFMESMEKLPPVLRTEYSYALLAEKNPEKAEKFKEQFEKIARKYPYPCEIESERELMDIAFRKYKTV